MSLTEIKSAIELLSIQERCELNAWLQNWPDDEWDRQMKRDAASGKLDFLLRESDAAYQRGECRPLP